VRENRVGASPLPCAQYRLDKRKMGVRSIDGTAPYPYGGPGILCI